MNDRGTKLRELADRFEHGMADEQEIIDAFASMPYDLIEKVEAVLQAGGIQGLPFLPRSLNPGSTAFRSAMERYKEVHAMGNEATHQEIMLSFIKMYRLAPPWWNAEMDKFFDETFSVSPDGYTESGEPVFSVESIARFLGRSESDVLNDVRSLEEGGFQITFKEKFHSVN